MVVFEGTAPPLSELDIKRVEHRLGVRLPEDIKQHYLLHNGGRPNPRFFVRNGEAYEVHEFFSMNPADDESSFERAYEILVGQTPEFPRGYVPFAGDSTGDVYIYSVRPESCGNIALCSHEDYEDHDRYVVFLAPTLREFINFFTEDPDEL